MGKQAVVGEPTATGLGNRVSMNDISVDTETNRDDNSGAKAPDNYHSK